MWCKSRYFTDRHRRGTWIASPRWPTPEQMLQVKVLASMHQVQTLFFFHLSWSVSSQIAYPRKLISRPGESITWWHYSRPECCLRICCLWCLQNPSCDCQASRCAGFRVIFHSRPFFLLCGFDSLSLSPLFFPSLSHCFFSLLHLCLSIRPSESIDVRSARAVFGDSNK